MLIFATINDIGYFMVLFMVSLVMFAFPLTILNNINQQADENPLIGDLTGFGPADGILKQYEEVLSGFGTISFAETQPMMSVLTIIIFICATFFTQITMLNMLIAIMGDTFERISENRPLFATRTKLSLLADYAANIRTAPTPDDLAKKFLFVVEPEEEEEGFDETWFGTVHQLDTLNKKHSNLLHKQNAKKFDLLDEKIMDVEVSMGEIKSDIENMNDLVTNTIVKTKHGSLKSDVSNVQESVGDLNKKITSLEKNLKKEMDERMGSIEESLKIVTNNIGQNKNGGI